VAGKLAGFQEEIRSRVVACPDATLLELQSWLEKTHRVTAGAGLLCRTLTGLQLTYNKSHCGPPSRTGQMLPNDAVNGASTNRPS